MRGLYAGFTHLVYLYTIYANVSVMLLVLRVHSDNAKCEYIYAIFVTSDKSKWLTAYAYSKHGKS